MSLAEDQHAVEELAAHGAGEAFADRVHARRLDGGAQDPGAGGLEDGVEGAGEVRSAVADEEPDVLEPLAEAHAEIAGLLHRPLTGGVRDDAAEMNPAGAVLRVPCSMKTRMYSLFSSTVSTCRKSTARIPPAWACRNCRQVGPARRGAGSMPAACRIFHTVDGATAMPSFVSSPRMRRCPHSGFSFARRTTRRAVPGSAGGRACAGCSSRTFSRPACGARPA